MEIELGREMPCAIFLSMSPEQVYIWVRTVQQEVCDLLVFASLPAPYASTFQKAASRSRRYSTHFDYSVNMTLAFLYQVNSGFSPLRVRVSSR